MTAAAFDEEECLALLISALDPAWAQAARRDLEAMAAPWLRELEERLARL